MRKEREIVYIPNIISYSLIINHLYKYSPLNSSIYLPVGSIILYIIYINNNTIL